MRPFLGRFAGPAALSVAVFLVTTSAMADIRPRPDWIAGARQPAALFGFSVATAGDVDADGFDDVIVGGCCYANPEHNAGRAFVFHGGPSGLGRTPRWSAAGHQEFGYFGGDVGTAGDVNGDGFADVIVGAWGEARAYAFHGSPSGLSRRPSWTASGVEYFGDSVGSAGDVNGDGYDDVIVGSPHQPPGFIGGAFLYFGSPDGLSETAGWSVLGPGGIDYFGSAVATAGDVSGDGFDDVIIGAHEDDAGEGNEGRAFVYHGSPSGPSDSPDWVRAGDEGFSHFGYSVGPAGDVNGDGFDDVTVGAPFYTNGGRAYAFLGSPSGLAQEPDWTANGSLPGEETGHSVRTAGDLNGDGYDDLIVGAPWYTGFEADEGRILVFNGSPEGLQSNPAWTAESDEPGLLYCTCFGWSVSTAGDVNGDGRADVVVGAPYYTVREQEEGIAAVYLGRP